MTNLELFLAILDVLALMSFIFSYFFNASAADWRERTSKRQAQEFQEGMALRLEENKGLRAHKEMEIACIERLRKELQMLVRDEIALYRREQVPVPTMRKKK